MLSILGAPSNAHHINPTRVSTCKSQLFCQHEAAIYVYLACTCTMLRALDMTRQCINLPQPNTAHAVISTSQHGTCMRKRTSSRQLTSSMVRATSKGSLGNMLACPAQYMAMAADCVSLLPSSSSSKGTCNQNSDLCCPSMSPGPFIRLQEYNKNTDARR